MKMRHYLVTAAVALFMVSQANAQVSGYAGKRHMLKYSVDMSVLEKGYGIEWESVLTRNRTIVFSYESGGRNYRTNLDYVDLLNGNEIVTDGEEPLKSSIEFSRVKLGFKKYWNPAFPAPIGWYTMYEISRATNTINSQTFDEVPMSIFETSWDDDYYLIARDVEIRNVNSTSLAIHFGKQSAFGRRFLVDFRYGFIMNTFDKGEEIVDIIYPAANYSGNLSNFGLGNLSSSYSNSDDGRYIENTWSFGFSVFLKAGMLLF